MLYQFVLFSRFPSRIGENSRAGAPPGRRRNLWPSGLAPRLPPPAPLLSSERRRHSSPRWRHERCRLQIRRERGGGRRGPLLPALRRWLRLRRLLPVRKAWRWRGTRGQRHGSGFRAAAPPHPPTGAWHHEWCPGGPPLVRRRDPAADLQVIGVLGLVGARPPPCPDPGCQRRRHAGAQAPPPACVSDPLPSVHL
ncbi:hypothetical protein PAHAL_9G255400 [Panicum hallii]|uniref:Uncharacterized protein n=1 Tax=Panicum hallii TaxID=206008 RepID=A0A2T8I2J5_9POAL|nr:hypothetical protein PAHAL_9G255400 [Panicum hallii]